MKYWTLPKILIFAVVLVGLIIRLHGLVWTLPYYFWGDETRLLLNGISVQTTGIQSYSAGISQMANYPPYRGWEVAMLRSLLTLGGSAPPNAVLVLFGRLLSLCYALITIGVIYQLGKRLTHNPMVGIVAALFFAVFPHVTLFGQRILADGAGLMFFMLCAWLSLLAYQKMSYQLLVGAIIAGVLAGLGKYNYATGLLLPAMVGMYFFTQRPRQIFVWVILPSLIAATPLLLFAIRTVSQDDLFYLYLDETSQLEGELRALQVRGYTPESPEWRALYGRYPMTTASRLESNYTVLRVFLPHLTIALTAFGVFSLLLIRPPNYDYRGLIAIAAVAAITILAFSFFRIVEGRQVFHAIFIAGLFIAIGLVNLARFSRIGAVVITGIFLIPMGVEAWNQNIDFTRPDVRVATVEWFLENTSDGTGVAIEDEPYEFWEQNGYNNAKHFNTLRTYRLWDNEPQTWENTGYYYLVADSGYEWRGGYYAGHPLEDAWNADVEVVARFEGDDYVGNDRMIIRVFKPQVKTEIDFGEVVTLYGYDVESLKLQAGDTLRIKYYWQAQNPNTTRYIMFNNLFDPQTETSLAQFDRVAGNNLLSPSDTWIPKQWVFDELELVIPEDAQPGTYPFLMGLYEPDTFNRLPVAGDDDNAVHLFDVTIIESETP